MKCSDIHIRDPFVLVYDGRYYMYGTRGETCWGMASGFDVYVSTDLENWEGPHECFGNDGTFWADRNYWAPEVHEYKGAFYMFASFKNAERRRGTAILKAESPMGPFAPHSDGCITPADWECLDGTFYVSREGKPYMVFCHEWVQVTDGEICAIELTDDLKAPAGDPKLLFHASEAKWCKEYRGSRGEHGYVTDGPFMWRTADGTLLCLWASMSEGGYTQALATSDNGDIDGGFIQTDTLYTQDGGHGMVFTALDGQMYLTLHCPNSLNNERPIFLPIAERGGRLVMDRK